MSKITSITCHNFINSRGDWTIKTKVKLDDGATGMQMVPEGASKGEKEAVSAFSVDDAVQVVSGIIQDALVGKDPFDQKNIDQTMLDLDDTHNKSNLGGNSILSVSLAVAQAAAKSEHLELYSYLKNLFGNASSLKFPTPVFNILNGGKHAGNGLSFQEFMVIPAQDKPFDLAMDMGVTIYHKLKDNLLDQDLDTDVGDEGGFAPSHFTVPRALSFIRDAASQRYVPGKDVFFGMDVAAESFYNKETSKYVISEESLDMSSDALRTYYSKLLDNFEIIYLEDPFYEEDMPAWEKFNAAFSKRLMVVADDLVVTNPLLLEDSIKNSRANAVIVKPNQVGTLTETFDFVKKAQDNNMAIVVSHRSGDTAEDTFIADLALAVGADFIKSGAPARGERVAKYNRLLEVFYNTQP